MHTTTLPPPDTLQTSPATEQLHTPPSFFKGNTLGDYCRLGYYAGKVALGAMFDTTDKVVADFKRYIKEPELPATTEAEDPEHTDSRIDFADLLSDDSLLRDFSIIMYTTGILALNGVESIGNNVWQKVRKLERPTLLEIVTAPFILPFRAIGKVARGTVAIPGKMSSLVSDRVPSDNTFLGPHHSAAMDIKTSVHGPL